MKASRSLAWTTCAFVLVSKAVRSQEYDQVGPCRTRREGASRAFASKWWVELHPRGGLLRTGWTRNDARLMESRNVSTCRGQEVLVETTLPDCDTMDAPYPIVYFYQGFGARPKDYYSYADRLSSWGYAVVQYNANTGEKDDIEIGFFGDVLNHLKESSLSPYLDFDRIGTAGHSRGGRLAAVTMAQWQDVSFGILIDPVDDEYMTGSRSIDQVDYPVAIVSSSVASECVPPQLNHAIFFEKSAPGSWLQVIRDSGHSQFSLAADGFLQSQVDPCARGTRAITDILELTYPTIVAWADYQLYGIGKRQYFDWVEQQEEKQFITWQEK